MPALRGSLANWNVELRKVGDSLILAMFPPTGKRPILLHAHLEPYRREVKRQLSARVGWSWGGVLKAVNPLSHKAALTGLYRKAKAIATDPRFAKGLSLAETFVPGLGATTGSIRAGVDLLKRAEAGITDAKKKIANIKKMAASGNPAAQQAFDLLSNLHGLQRVAEGKRTIEFTPPWEASGECACKDKQPEGASSDDELKEGDAEDSQETV